MFIMHIMNMDFIVGQYERISKVSSLRLSLDFSLVLRLFSLLQRDVTN